MTDRPRCAATRRDGAPCVNPAGPSGRCAFHDAATQRARGRKGAEVTNANERAKRAAAAAAMRCETLADLKAALTYALRRATELDELGALVSAIRTGAELIKSGDLEQQVVALRQLVEGPRGPRRIA